MWAAGGYRAVAGRKVCAIISLSIRNGASSVAVEFDKRGAEMETPTGSRISSTFYIPESLNPKSQVGIEPRNECNNITELDGRPATVGSPILIQIKQGLRRSKIHRRGLWLWETSQLPFL
jgi:hypothetical protein